MEYQYQLII